jgi:nucleoside-diphosphate-sugar epimerase
VRVLVTGGTGFVGSHIVSAVIRGGHAVRLFARRPERVEPALSPLGIHVDDVATGDVLDAEAVDRACDGCDAVIHAAAVYSIDPRRTAEVVRTNVRATEIVLGSAIRAEMRPIVHVSTFGALLPNDGVLDPDSPVGSGAPPYPRSKAESDDVARGLQADGAPVVITYPGAVAGPHDPYLGDTDFAIAMILRGRIPFAMAGGWPVADVGYVAEAHARILDRSRDPHRFLLCGHYVTWREMYAALRRVTGRRLRAIPTPLPVALAGGWMMDGLQRVVRPRLPFGAQGSWIVWHCRGSDDSRTLAELDLRPPPLDETLRDTIRWLVEAGHLPTRFAGRAAPR